MFGPALHPGAEAAKATGVKAVLPRDEFTRRRWRGSPGGRAIYTPFRPEVLGERVRGRPGGARTSRPAEIRGTAASRAKRRSSTS